MVSQLAKSVPPRPSVDVPGSYPNTESIMVAPPGAHHLMHGAAR
jgi:hypothetical protein